MTTHFIPNPPFYTTILQYITPSFIIQHITLNHVGVRREQDIEAVIQTADGETGSGR